MAEILRPTVFATAADRYLMLEKLLQSNQDLSAMSGSLLFEFNG